MTILVPKRSDSCWRHLVGDLYRAVASSIVVYSPSGGDNGGSTIINAAL